MALQLWKSSYPLAGTDAQRFVLKRPKDESYQSTNLMESVIF